MPVKLSTTIGSISSIPNLASSTLLYEFYQYMKSIGTSESYQNGNIKIIIYFARFLGPTIDFYSIDKKEQILIDFEFIITSMGIVIMVIDGIIIPK
jgi:hypothetical protein